MGKSLLSCVLFFWLTVYNNYRLSLMIIMVLIYQLCTFVSGFNKEFRIYRSLLTSPSWRDCHGRRQWCCLCRLDDHTPMCHCRLCCWRHRCTGHCHDGRDAPIHRHKCHHSHSDIDHYHFACHPPSCLKPAVSHQWQYATGSGCSAKKFHCRLNAQANEADEAAALKCLL